MGFLGLVEHAFDAYGRNIKLLSFLSVPFLISFSLSFLLPNYVASSGIFLRFGSMLKDLSLWESFFVIVVFLVSLFLTAFALAAINTVIKAQRTLHRLTRIEVEKIEGDTVKLFAVFMLAFFAILLINLLLYDSRLYTTVGALASFLISLAVIFAPQAIVIDNLSIRRSIEMSFSIVGRRLWYFILFLAVAAVLILLNTWIFLSLDAVFPLAKYVSLVTNALLILPFLEVLKVQLYLSKYTLLHKM
jgi:hypothetical protein